MTTLIADIGGTNCRCALAGPSGPEELRSFRNADFDGLVALLKSYLGGLETASRPASALLAVAAPVTGERVRMTNLPWTIDAAQVRDAGGFNDVRLLNDFEALAHALPVLGPDDLLQLGDGTAQEARPKAVIGPGTGLGVGALIPTAQGWQALPGEGGHVSLAAMNEREDALIRAARERFEHCSAERLISGPGLSLIHELLHGEAGIDGEVIGERLDSGDARALASFQQFCDFLGTVAGDLALTLGAFGGVYIGGGILPRHAQRFAASGFRERFLLKGRYANYLDAIPTYLITRPEPALQGLWACAGDTD